MKLSLIFAITLAACTTVRPLPALDSVSGGEAVIDLATSVRAAAEQCSANAQHLAHFDVKKGDALVDECVQALIPARDAVFFVRPSSERWTVGSPAAIGCAGKAVVVSLTRVRAAFLSSGYATSTSIEVGIRVGQSLSPYANSDCDPLHPTNERASYVSPHIARVTPEYPQ